MDYTVGDTIYLKFTTRQFSDGVPTTLSGTPVLSAYEDASITQITAGVSVTVDLDGVAGLNLATVIATSGNGFESGKHYGIVITTGTVGGTSVVGEVIGQFTLEKSAAYTRLGTPAGASIAADLVVIDNFVDDLESRLTAIRAGYLDNLSAGAVAQAAALATAQTDLDNIQTRLPAALVSGKMDSDAVAVGGSTDGANRLGKATQANVFCTVGSGSTTTSIVTSSMDPAASVTDQFKGKIVTFDANTTTANLRGQSTDITASTAAGVLTVTALTDAAVSGDTFVIT
ncbi:MAG: hypothetical protein BMS9Abin11_1835 [Gammaproteobacteria bacterium]|nr:MAG: hypothetical protein BMS9Abin11_1835 [Gammaproteobacteria bacterium]